MRSVCLALVAAILLALPLRAEERSYQPSHGIGQPSADDMALFHNAGYLTVVHDFCGLDVGSMPQQYRQRALSSSQNLSEELVDSAIARSVASNQQQADKKGRTRFCDMAKRNLPVFRSALAIP